MEPLTDVDYLVMRARQYGKSDPYASKAWLITAKALFPSAFVIQFESYQVEKASKNINEAAKHLEEMFRNFPYERQLWEEVQSMLEVLQTNSSDHGHTLLTEIFAAIPTNTQCQMLLAVADKIANTLERCRLLLMAMRNFTSLVHEHGLKLVELLVMEEGRIPTRSPINCYRKLLVCDVLPMVLKWDVRVKLTPLQLHTWLQMAIEFYISYITQPACGDAASGELLSPSKGRHPPVAGLLERESQVIDPWRSLFHLLVRVGQRLGWEFEKDIFSKSGELQWQYLLSQFNRAKQTHSDSGMKQVLYTAVVLFMQSVYLYVSSIDSDVSLGTCSSSQHIPIVLVEGFSSEPDSHLAHSRAKKLSGNGPPILTSSGIVGAPTLLSHFTTARCCYELLHTSEELKSDFLLLCSKWNKETWMWIIHLQVDQMLYQENWEKAVSHLQNSLDTSSGRMRTRYALQMASCFYCLRKYSKACELVLDIILTIPETDMLEFEQCEKLPVSSSARHLLMMQCTEKEYLSYCIKMLVSCLKAKVFSEQCSDSAIAHLIILLQYDWPNEEELFLKVVDVISQRQSLTYNLFFSYVFVVDMLEEFAFLDTIDGGQVNLDILPISTKQIAQQRTVTRGVNKGVKEDFRVALEKQVGRLKEPCHKVLFTFLKEQKEAILQNV